MLILLNILPSPSIISHPICLVHLINAHNLVFLHVLHAILIHHVYQRLQVGVCHIVAIVVVVSVIIDGLQQNGHVLEGDVLRIKQKPVPIQGQERYKRETVSIKV